MSRLIRERKNISPEYKNRKNTQTALAFWQALFYTIKHHKLNKRSTETIRKGMKTINTKTVMREVSDSLPVAFDPEDFLSVREHIIFRLAAERPEIYGDRVYRPFFDLRIIYQIAAGACSLGKVSIPIRENLLRLWNVTEPELFALAQKNTPRLYPSSLASMSDVLGVEDCGLKMFVLTNTEGFYGASAILYPGTLLDASRILNGDFWILPSSVHEVILVSSQISCTAAFLESMVCSVNAQHVAEQDVLGEHVYYYDSRTQRLR